MCEKDSLLVPNYRADPVYSFIHVHQYLGFSLCLKVHLRFIYMLFSQKGGHTSGLGDPKLKSLQILTMNVGESRKYD